MFHKTQRIFARNVGPHRIEYELKAKKMEYIYIHRYLRYTFSSDHNVHKSSCGLCFWAPHPLIGPGTHEQSPNELL